MASPSKKAVIDCLASCFNSEQAGGFENADNAGEAWIDLEPDISDMDDSGFVVHMGNACYRVRVTKIAQGSGQ